MGLTHMIGTGQLMMEGRNQKSFADQFEALALAPRQPRSSQADAAETACERQQRNADATLGS